MFLKIFPKSHVDKNQNVISGNILPQCGPSFLLCHDDKKNDNVGRDVLWSHNVGSKDISDETILHDKSKYSSAEREALLAKISLYLTKIVFLYGNLQKRFDLLPKITFSTFDLVRN